MPDIKNFFNIHSDLETKQQVAERIINSVSFRGANAWILITAILLASLGLNVNSTAVIIGAMLISPLMGPIIGMGLAVGTSDFQLLKRSLRNYGMATLISIVTATIYFLITPYRETQSELLARTTPNIYDVLIAFVGGAAGVIALSVKDKGNVIPGVAIATALMPPLCTAGFGIASGSLAYFAGAFFLYFINTVFIALATFFGVKLMGFEQRTFVDHKQQIVVRRSVFSIVVITLIPALYMTGRIVKTSYLQSQKNHFVRDQMSWEGTQVVSSDLTNDSTLNVVLVGRSVSKRQIYVAQQAMKAYNALRPYKLEVIQGGAADSLIAMERLVGKLVDKQKSTRKTYTDEEQNAIGESTVLPQLSKQISYEVAPLFPEVYSIGLSKMAVWTADSTKSQQVITAVIVSSGEMKAEEKSRLKEWLRRRAKAEAFQEVLREKTDKRK